MTAQECDDYLKDGEDPERLADFIAGEEAARAWARTHPLSLQDYLDSLQSVHDLFGTLPASHESWADWDFRL